MRAIVTTAGGVERDARGRAHTSSQFKSPRGMLACRFRRCPHDHYRAPTITKCAAPQSSKRQRDGLAIYPVSRQLVRRLLIASLRHVHDPYSMTSSARASNVGGTVRPSAIAGPDINRNQSLQHRAVVNAGAPRGFAIAIAKRAAPSAATRKLEEREVIAAGFALLNQSLYLPKPPRR